MTDRKLGFQDGIRLRTNIDFVLRNSHGTITERHTHNIWLDYGREWLLSLMSYSDGSTPYTDSRVFCMGLGIGGTRQTATIPEPANSDYWGTNNQDDSDPTIEYLERPVRVTYTGGLDYWLKSINFPPTFNPPATPPYYVTYETIFGPTDVSYGSYPTIPLSEVALFEKDTYTTHNNELYANVYKTPPVRPTPIAYDTFYPIWKTAGVTLEVYWTIQL